MGYANINIGNKTPNPQKNIDADWGKQVAEDQKLKSATGVVENAGGYSSVEDVVNMQDLLDQSNYDVDLWQQSGKMRGKSPRDAAMGVMQEIPPSQGNRAGGDLFTGPNVEHYSDMDLVNQGVGPQGSAAGPLRDAINYDLQDEALSIAGDPIVLKDHTDYSQMVINEIGNVASGMSSNQKIGMDYISRTAEELKMEPSTVAEYLRTWVTDFKTLENNGIPEAFSDTALHAVLHTLKMQKLSEAKKEQTGEKETVAEAQEKENASMATHESIGALIESAFQVKNGTPTTRALGGALALRAVTDALGSVDYGRGHIEDKNNAGLFQTKLINTTGEKTLWVSELTEAGINAAESLSALGESIIPGMKKDVNPTPQLNVKTGEIATVSRVLQRKEDKRRRAGKAVDTNKGINALNGAAHRINKEVAQLISDSLQNPEAVDVIEGPGYMNIKGIEWNGAIHKRKDDGSTYRVRYVIQNEINGQPNPNPGRKVPNPMYGRDPNEKSQWLTEPNNGDFMKDLVFNETLQWVADHVGDEAFYYTHFIGGAKRVHVDQTLGNYQSNKLARGLIESAIPYAYSLKGDGAVALKAGILKKFGMNKAKNGSNKQLAAEFDTVVYGWKKIQTPFLEGGGTGLAPELLELAGGHEGWSSVSAIAEGIKLNMAETNGDSEYRSGFITEIDGTANGVAINSMYAGDRRSAVLTGMIGSDPDNDVYTITSKMFNELAAQHQGSLGPRFARVWNQLTADRSMAKQPLMTFGYGAGNPAIAAGFKEELWKRFDEDAEFKEKAMDILGVDNHADLATFVNESADIMVSAVGTNFPALKTLSRVISAITSTAVLLGIPPHTITDNNDFIEFGLSNRVIDEDKSFAASVRKGKGVSSKQRGRIISISPMMRENDPAGLSADRYGTFDAKTMHVSTLKASSQAPVLVTHAIDSLVMMRSMDKMKQKLGNNFYAAQIFDGVMMMPAHAQMFSDALHRELIHMGKNYSIVNSLLESLYNQDPGRFKEMAQRNGMKEGEDFNDYEKVMKHAIMSTKENAEIVIPDIPVFNVKTGEDTYHSLRQLVPYLEDLRAKYVKKMKIENMYQYGWDFPAKK